MHRWVSILLLALLPLQSVWAVASFYCQHETGAGAEHVEHHDHQHDAESDAPVPSAGTDPDCGTCHSGCVTALAGIHGAAVLAVGGERPGDASSRLPAARAAPPERPNWTDLA